jgi:hypothetical protein
MYTTDPIGKFCVASVGMVQVCAPPPVNATTLSLSASTSECALVLTFSVLKEVNTPLTDVACKSAI